MKQEIRYYIAAVVILVLVFISLSIQDIRRREVIRQRFRTEMTRREDSITKIKVERNDSIARHRQERLEQMATQKMSATIFAGLRFGDNPDVVEKAMRNAQIIQVPIGDEVMNIDIVEYKALYHKGKLASLILYSNNDNGLDSLYALYCKKYGEGIVSNYQYYEWAFSNCKITIERKYRIKHKGSYDLYNEELYYSGFEEKGSHLTSNDSFVKITYESNKLVKMIEREKFLADSLKKAEHLQAIEKEKAKEKELARKLETEVPTNI